MEKTKQLQKFQPVAPCMLTRSQVTVYKNRAFPRVREIVAQDLQGETDAGILGGEAYAKSLISAHLIKSFKLVGLKPENFPDKERGIMLINFVYEKHGWIRPAEIFAAFDYAVSVDAMGDDGKSLIDHYQNIDVRYVNRILNFYRGYAHKVEQEAQAKEAFYLGALAGWKAARLKDDESMKNMALNSYSQYVGAEPYTYWLLFSRIYDWFDYMGLIDLTLDEKKAVAEEVTKQEKAVATNIREALRKLSGDTFKNLCKRLGLVAQFRKWGSPRPLQALKGVCYMNPDSFAELWEIQAKLKELKPV